LWPHEIATGPPRTVFGGQRDAGPVFCGEGPTVGWPQQSPFQAVLSRGRVQPRPTWPTEGDLRLTPKGREPASVAPALRGVFSSSAPR
jgi:hypothetical protein